MMRFAGVVMLSVEHDPILRGSWEDGPLPLRLPFGGHTDIDARKTYFDGRAARVLYGERPDSERRHAIVDVDAGSGLRLEACEYLRMAHLGDDVEGLLILHLLGSEVAPATTRDAWADLLRWKAGGDGGVRIHELLHGALGGPAPLSSRYGPLYHCSFLSGVADAAAPYPDSSMQTSDQWLFAYASATPSGSYTPHEEHVDDLMRHRLPLSADWTALVLRDGVSFLGHGDPDGEFLSWPAPLYVRTIYTDALLIGVAQKLALGELTDRLSALDDPAKHARTVERLDVQFSHFRNSLWWQHLTQHGTGNELLLAFQEQRNLPALMEQTKSELEDYSRQANLRAGRVLNSIVALFAVVGGLGVVIEGYALYRPDSVPDAATTAAAIVVAGVTALLLLLYALGVLSRK